MEINIQTSTMRLGPTLTPDHVIGGFSKQYTEANVDIAFHCYKVFKIKFRILLFWIGIFYKQI